MTDLDRLLELRDRYNLCEECYIITDVEPKIQKEYESLKAKIEGNIEKAEFNKDFESYMKWCHGFDDLESQVGNLKIARQASITVRDSEIAKLKEEIETYINAESKEINQLKSTLDEIETLAGSDTCPECMAIENLNELIAKHEGKQ